jgi:hypothetical protein
MENGSESVTSNKEFLKYNMALQIQKKIEKETDPKRCLSQETK